MDAELFDLIEDEKYRQWSGLELIASEVRTSRALMCSKSAVTSAATVHLSPMYCPFAPELYIASSH